MNEFKIGDTIEINITCTSRRARQTGKIYKKHEVQGAWYIKFKDGMDSYYNTDLIKIKTNPIGIWA